MDDFLDHYLHDFLLTFWQFLERFLVILGTKYEACLGGSFGHITSHDSAAACGAMGGESRSRGSPASAAVGPRVGTWPLTCDPIVAHSAALFCL